MFVNMFPAPIVDNVSDVYDFVLVKVKEKKVSEKFTKEVLLCHRKDICSLFLQIFHKTPNLIQDYEY